MENYLKAFALMRTHKIDYDDAVRELDRYKRGSLYDAVVRIINDTYL